MRPSEPEFLRQWREWDAMGPPKCCHTCIAYAQDGRCDKFGMVPPEEFVGTPDACEQWELGVPF